MIRIALVFVLLLSSAVVYLGSGFQKDVRNELSKNFQLEKKHLNEVILGYQINSQITFKNTIMQADVLNILRQVEGADQQQFEQLHDQLYLLLIDEYRNLQQVANVRQLHFHLPDGRSFLRMHRPNKYGDPLFDVRHSVQKANQKKVTVQGFEEGRIFNGYRFVYPIIDNGRHLGSVEISVSMAALIDSLKDVYGGIYCFILDSEVIGKKLFADERGNYMSSPFGEKFAIDKGLQNDSCQLDNPYVSELVKNKELNKKLEFRQPVSEVIGHFWQSSFNATVAQFIPIENVAGKKLAYIYSIHQDKALLALYSRLTYNVILTTLILTVLLAVALFLRQHHAWLNKQKLLLEEKVIERTKQIEFSLQKELYIKRVLETIFTVSEHLNVAEKIDNLLYESCERLTLHEHYHFAHIKTFNDDLQVALSRSVIRQGMQIQNIQRFYDLMEKSNGIEERIHNGDIVIIKNIDEHAYAQPIIEFIRRNHINTAVLIPLSSEASVIDIFGYLTILTSHEQNLAEERILFKELGQTISQAILSLKRKEKYEQVLQEKVSNYKEMIFAMVELMEKRDAYTAGHTRRVSAYSRLIAEKMGLDQKAISDITEAAMLHDIGKIVTPDSILLKPGRLNDEEFAIIKDHVTVGAEVLDKLEFFKELKEIMLYHHEKYDGSGYPFGLKGEEIPLLARIMTVADAFDAMTSHRIYKSKLNIQQAIQELERGKGSHFDPSVVNVAKKVLQEVSLEATESQLPVSGPDYERMAYYFKDQLTGLLNESYLAILLENHFVGQSIKALQVLTIQAEGMQAAELEKRYTDLGTLIKPAYPTSLCFFIKSGVFILIHRDSIHLKQQEQLLAEFEAQNGVVIHIENLNMIDEEQCVQRLEAIAGLEAVSETPVQES